MSLQSFWENTEAITLTCWTSSSINNSTNSWTNRLLYSSGMLVLINNSEVYCCLLNTVLLPLIFNIIMNIFTRITITKVQKEKKKKKKKKKKEKKRKSNRKRSRVTLSFTLTILISWDCLFSVWSFHFSAGTSLTKLEVTSMEPSSTKLLPPLLLF